MTHDSLIRSLVPAIQVEARPCLHCASDEAVPEGASWANAALSCALFVADVRSLVRKGEGGGGGQGNAALSCAPFVADVW